MKALWRIRLMISNSGGIGDELLLSTVAAELSKRGRRDFALLSQYPELFTSNPDVPMTIRPGGRLHRLMRLGVPHIDLGYHRPGGDVPKVHILRFMCDRAGIDGQIQARPYLYLSKAEQNDAAPYRGSIIIQSSGLAATYPMLAKEYFPQPLCRVTEALSMSYRILQVGSKKDPLLNAVEDLRGKTSLRQLAGLLSVATAYIGNVGLLMHLARAVDCPSVIIYGGREHPSTTGYSANINLYEAVECAPCWLYTCPYDRECMRRIEPKHIIAALEAAATSRSTIRTAIDYY
jgi:hypothetical protein